MGHAAVAAGAAVRWLQPLHKVRDETSLTHIDWHTHRKELLRPCELDFEQFRNLAYLPQARPMAFDPTLLDL